MRKFIHNAAHAFLSKISRLLDCWWQIRRFLSWMNIQSIRICKTRLATMNNKNGQKKKSRRSFLGSSANLNFLLIKLQSFMGFFPSSSSTVDRSEITRVLKTRFRNIIFSVGCEWFIGLKFNSVLSSHKRQQFMQISAFFFLLHETTNVTSTPTSHRRPIQPEITWPIKSKRLSEFWE